MRFRMPVSILTIGSVMVLGFANYAGAGPKNFKLPTVTVKTWKMDNGLRVVHVPRHRVPVVTVQIWYHAGSKDEAPGIRGVAHMFEHMMFKGSKFVPPEKHAQLLSAIGGSVNAFTTEDVTAYHDTLPSQYFDFAVKLEAERMRNLLLIKKTVNSEREVVKEEKRVRLENSPLGRALEALFDIAYTKHPYSWTPAGDIPDLNRVTTKDCKEFYDTYYVPNNATLIVVGDVKEDQVRKVAEKYFGTIPKGKDPPVVKILEPAQTKAREKLGDWPSQLSVVIGGYHIPNASHRDMPALRILSAILSSGKSSRLHQSLVRKNKLAIAAGGFARSVEHPGLFFLWGVGLPKDDVTKMKTGLLDEVDKVIKDGVTKQELTKAKNQMVTRYLSGLKTVSGLAMQIGLSAYIHGDPRAFIKAVERLDGVTADDVKRVASTYLKQNNLSLVLLKGGQGGK